MTEQEAFGQTRFTAPNLREEQLVFEDRYLLKKVIGQGGMGVVWKAEDTTLKHPVALKFLPDLVRLDAEAIHRLKGEAKKGRQLHHTNIVAIYDFLEEGGYSAVAMEYVEGEPLTVRKLSKVGECFDPPQIRAWVDQLCEALHYAHQNHGIVHRDIKPANILVDQNNNVRILDFGLSRVMSDSLTRLSAGDFKGASLGYSSPEQISGRPPAISDDIYSLGATIYELLTGQPPFYTGDIYNQTLSQIPPPMEERRAELGVTGKEPVPPEWELTVAACMAKEPADRPPDTMEVGSLLSGGAAKKPSRKRKLPVALLGSALAAACIVGGFFLLPEWWNPGDSGTGSITPVAPAKSDSERTSADHESDTTRTEKKDSPPSNSVVAKGTVMITSQPSAASVFSESGVRLGTTPLTLDSVAPGPASYHIDKEGYRTGKAGGFVESGGQLSLSAELEAITGSIRLTSSPSQAIVFDSRGDMIGTTPLDLPGLAPGRVSYRVTMDGYEDSQVEGVVRDGESTPLSARLKQLMGSVTIYSVPSGASVYSSSNTILGTTPLTLDDVPPGPVFYTIKLNGYGDMTAKGEVTAGQGLSFTATMERDTPWMFPDSDRRFLTDIELGVLTKDQLWIARNEIYARRGLEFQTARGEAYGASLGSFYTARYSDQDALYETFNTFERKNIERILLYEKR